MNGVSDETRLDPHAARWAEEIPPPPRVLNRALAVAILFGLLVLQVMGSQLARRNDWSLAVALGVAFSFLFLPLYSLLHEAEHRAFDRDRRINDAFGVALAALFPGSFTFLRACHLGHHRRNRTEAERFDLSGPADSLAQKRAAFYALYLGGFWLTVPLATVLLLVNPRLLRAALIQDAPGAAAMLGGVPRAWLRRIRLECAAVVALHAAVVMGLHLSPAVYLLFYGLAGLNWSSQQYVTHAASPLHVTDGAHNLRAHALYAALLLNFNWHLAHHQNPGVPWIHLPRYDDPTRLRPGYLRAFVRFWRGPQPLDHVAPAVPPSTLVAPRDTSS